MKRPQDDGAAEPNASGQAKRIKVEGHSTTVVGVTTITAAAAAAHTSQSSAGGRTASAASIHLNGGGAGAEHSDDDDEEEDDEADMTEAQLKEKRESEARIKEIPLLSIHRTM